MLLHGLARSKSSMGKLEKALGKQNYFVVNHQYPSTEKRIEVLAAEELPRALKRCPANEKVNFVTHSLGGILLRQYLSKNTVPKLGRSVMLGPPNRGSQAVDKLKNVPGYSVINGPAGRQLGTDAESLPLALGKVEFELGVIAGSKSINLFLSTVLPNPDDGKVSVENTKTDGMADHIVFPVSHTFIMKNDKVIRQVVYFLRFGKFDRESAVKQ